MPEIRDGVLLLKDKSKRKTVCAKVNNRNTLRKEVTLKNER